MIMYENDDLIAIASEEVSLNRLFPGQRARYQGTTAGDLRHMVTIDLAQVPVREANERIRRPARAARTSRSSTPTRATISASA